MDSNEMRQWCVGRLLVSLPANLRPVSSAGDISGVEIEVVPNLRPEDAMNDRRRKLLSGAAELDGVPIKQISQIQQQGQPILSYAQDFSELGSDVTTGDWYEETYVAAANDSFRLIQFVSPDQSELRRKELLDVATAIQPMSADHIGADGACLGPAFVALPPGDETVSISFADPEGSGAIYQIDYLHRQSGSRPLDFEGRSAVEGTQRVQVAGLDGLEQTPEATPREFAAIAGRPGSATQAGIKIMVQRIEQDSQPVPYDQAVVVWRAILTSMKLKL